MDVASTSSPIVEEAWTFGSNLLGPHGEPEGNPRAVTAGIGIRHAAFSPDGTKLAYSWGRLVANVWRVPILEDRPATWADAEQLTFEQAFVRFHARELDELGELALPEIVALERVAGRLREHETEIAVLQAVRFLCLATAEYHRRRAKRMWKTASRSAQVKTSAPTFHPVSF